MRKTAFFILILSIFLVTPSVIYGQTTDVQAESGRSIVCLNAARCGDCGVKKCTPNPDCSGNYIGSPEHRAVLTKGSGEIQSGQVYIFECFPRPADEEKLAEMEQKGVTWPKETINIDGTDEEQYINPICTLGNADTDLTIFGKDNFTILENAFSYQFEGFFKTDGTTSESQPIPAVDLFTASNPKFEWEDTNNLKEIIGLERRFYALSLLEPALGGEAATGNANTQQQTTLDNFSWGSDLDTTCASVHWDPYGRVFDSFSLEPINGAKITLLVKRKDGSYTPMTSNDMIGGYLVNPQTTDIDGIFNFVVPEGDYKLDVSHPDYDFPVTADKLNPNYVRIYRNAYPVKTGEVIAERIDTPEEKLRGQPDPERRDVPLLPKKSGLTNEIKLMEFFHEKIKGTGNSYIDGRVSHPFAFIDVYSQKFDTNGNKVRGQLIASTQADRLGFFQLKVEETKFSPGEFFGEIVFYKTDLNNLDKKPVAPAAKKTDVEPIPNYIEGYAYDNTGKVLPKATVGVYLYFSTKPYYVTSANEKGYYKIASTHLPFFPYYLKYTSSTGQVIKLGTAKFISQNDQFIKGSKIDLVSFRDEKGDKLSTKDIAKLNLKEQEKQSSSGEQLNNEDTNKKNIILIIIVLLILIVGVLVFGLVYIVKKTKEISPTF